METLRNFQINYGPTNFLECYMNLAFYLCVCPFRLKRVNSEGTSQHKTVKCQYIKQSNWLQKSCCTLFSLMAYPWILRESWNATPSLNANAGPGVYFQMSCRYMNFIQKIIMFKLLWFDQTKLVEIFNFLSNEKGGLPPYKFRISKLAISCFILPYVLTGVVAFVLGRGLVSTNIPDWNVAIWWQLVQCTSKNIYLFQSVTVSDTTHCSNSTTVEVVLGIFGSIGLFLRYSFKILIALLIIYI